MRINQAPTRWMLMLFGAMLLPCARVAVGQESTPPATPVTTPVTTPEATPATPEATPASTPEAAPATTTDTTPQTMAPPAAMPPETTTAPTAAAPVADVTPAPQTPAPTPDVAPLPQTATPPPDATATPAVTTPVPEATQTPEAATPPAAAAKSQPQAKKEGKQPYTGPTDVITLPPAPLLDADGKERVDNDGNPILGPPQVQQRDRLGHPLFDADGKPIFRTVTDAGYDAKGKKIPVPKVKAAAAARPGKTPPQATALTTEAAGAAPGPPKPKPPVDKKGRPIYTGPTDVIVLPPTPMLDEEGKQRVDPDGNPMFNSPEIQQRDKLGHPLFDAAGKPVFRSTADAGYDAKGKKIPVAKVKVVKTIPVVISRGTFTVDGMIGKAELNYTIPTFKFLYLYAPGVCIAVVSNSQFEGATMEKNAFKDNTLTVTIQDHVLQLASDKQIIGRRGVPAPAYVKVDCDFTLPSKFPVVGYGITSKAPYAWPGAKRNTLLSGTYKPPPTPKNLLPTELLSACPAGQMRMPTPPALPGQKTYEQPCVTITKALQAEEAMQKAQQAAAQQAAAKKAAEEPVVPAADVPTAADTPTTVGTPAGTPAATPPPATSTPPPSR